MGRERRLLPKNENPRKGGGEMTANSSPLAELGLSVAAGLLGLTLVMTVLAAVGAALAREA